MNTKNWITAIAGLTVLVAASNAFADQNETREYTGKTRAEVLAELQQAQQDGTAGTYSFVGTTNPAAAAGNGAKPQPSNAGPSYLKQSSTPIHVSHLTVGVAVDYDRFIGNFESILGRFDQATARQAIENPSQADALYAKMAGPQGLMIFDSMNHGAMYARIGQHRKAKRYYIGNPQVAFSMMREDIRAGEYAPLIVYVYEDAPKSIRIEYDRPSDLFGQFQNGKVDAVAQALDAKFANVIDKAAAMSLQQQVGAN